MIRLSANLGMTVLAKTARPSAPRVCLSHRLRLWRGLPGGGIAEPPSLAVHMVCVECALAAPPTLLMWLTPVDPGSHRAQCTPPLYTAVTAVTQHWLTLRILIFCCLGSWDQCLSYHSCAYVKAKSYLKHTKAYIRAKVQIKLIGQGILERISLSGSIHCPVHRVSLLLSQLKGWWINISSESTATVSRAFLEPLIPFHNC